MGSTEAGLLIAMTCLLLLSAVPVVDRWLSGDDAKGDRGNSVILNDCSSCPVNDIDITAEAEQLLCRKRRDAIEGRNHARIEACFGGSGRMFDLFCYHGQMEVSGMGMHYSPLQEPVPDCGEPLPGVGAVERLIKARGGLE